MSKSSVCYDVVFIEVNGRCNLSCKYCYTKHIKEALPKERVLEFLSKYIDDFISSDNDPFEVFWIGRGEASLWGHLAESINFLNDKYKNKITHSIQTNGILIHNTVNQLHRVDNLRVSISLDGLEEAHDYNRGLGTFKKIVQNVKELLSKNVSIDFMTILLPKTIETAPDFLKFIKELSPQSEVSFLDCFTHEIVKSLDNTSNSLILPPITDQEIQKSIQLLETKEYEEIKTLIYKGAYNRYICISCEGDIFTCCELQRKIGTMDVDIQTLKKRLDDESLCNGCIYFNTCYP